MAHLVQAVEGDVETVGSWSLEAVGDLMGLRLRGRRHVLIHGADHPARGLVVTRFDASVAHARRVHHQVWRMLMVVMLLVMAMRCRRDGSSCLHLGEAMGTAVGSLVLQDAMLSLVLHWVPVLLRLRVLLMVVLLLLLLLVAGRAVARVVLT